MCEPESLSIARRGAVRVPRNRGYLLLLAPVLAYLVLFFVYPLARTLLQSLFDPGFTTRHYADLFKYPVYLRVIWNTIRISFTATLVCVALGYPIAWCLSGPESNWTRALLFAVLLPFWISILIRTFAWMVILGREGIVNQLLLRAGLIEKPLHLIYNRFGVCVGLFPEQISRIDWNRYGLIGFCGLVFCFLILPVFVIIPVAFSNDPLMHFPPHAWGVGLFREFFTSGKWLEATANSFRIAIAVMLLATALGTPAAYSLARGKYRGRGGLFALLVSPLIIPAIVSAISIYFLFARFRLIGSITGMVLAHTVLAVPYVLVVMTTAFAGLDERLEQASMSLGAGRLRTFFGVTLPLVRPAVITSMLFAFIASFDELITAMFICGVRAITLPKQMWDGIRDEIDPVISAVAVLLILLSTLLLMISLFVKKKRRIGSQ
ncbi:MAG: ABC transporter permease subunit [Syntrophobacteraceae bacterium]